MTKAHVIGVCCVAILAMAGFAQSASAKTVKECTAEWTANKATIQASGKTRAKFIAECRGTGTAAEPAAKTVPAKSETKAAPAAAKTVVAGKDQYASEADAKSHCAADTVVWVNLRSKIYHLSGDRSYGKTKRGAYMCEKTATADGFRAPKTRAKKS